MRTSEILLILVLGVTAQAAEQPNIIIYMVDDLGWNHIGVDQGTMGTYGKHPDLTRELKNIYRAQKKYPELKAVILEEHLANPRDFRVICQLGEAYFLNVSLELAKSTSFFNDALNEILAGGQKVF